MAIGEADREELVAYLDGELDEVAARTLEARLNSDPEMRAEFESLKQTWELLDYLPRAERSQSFTQRTMQRLAVHRAVTTMKVERPAAPTWLTFFAWFAAALLALGLGWAIGGFLAPSAAVEEESVEALVTRFPHLISNLPLYRNIGDWEFLKALERTELFSHLPVRIDEGGDYEAAKAQVRDWQKNEPAMYGRLLDQARAFLHLSQAEQLRLKKMARRLRNLPPLQRQRMYTTLHAYGVWLLHRVNPEERQQLQQADSIEARLALVRKLHEQKWVAGLPKVHRDRLAQLQGPNKEKYIQQLRDREKGWYAMWQLAFYHWNELHRKRSMPTRLDDFLNKKGRDREIGIFVMEYLKPLLSEQEWQRLKAAEGRWPHFLCTLVELADRHPIALPGPRGPGSFRELPKKIQALLKRGKAYGELRRLEREGYTGWPKFASAVAQVLDRQVLRAGVPYELWPTRHADLSVDMRSFVTRTLIPLLSREEKAALRKAEGSWPDYPVAIRDLAERYGLDAPWQTLPGRRSAWNGYRIPNYHLISEW